MPKGIVYLVGAGPGDAGLLTLRGRRLLEEAEVVVYDALVGPAILAMMPRDAEKIDVGKRAGNHPVPQEQINGILLEKALEGKKVVRLKGGDPFLIGRGGEELELLCDRQIPFEVVPGIPSAISVPAYLGIPVTHRDFCSSVHFVTGHTKKNPEAEIDYEALARLKGTLVFLMGLSAMEVICRRLEEAGVPPDMPAAVLERGTTAGQRAIVSTLAELPAKARAERAASPALLVVGEVCSLAGRFHWADGRTLQGARVLVTRPRERASRLTETLRDKGAEVVELPTIRVRAIEPNPALSEALREIKEDARRREKTPGYSWLVFTSPGGAEIFFSCLRENAMDVRSLHRVRIAAIGSATGQALEEHGILCDLVPEEYNAAALGAALVREYIPGGRLLLLRAREASPDLTRALEEGGVPYTEIPLYETLFENCGGGWADKLPEELDYAAFSSASTVHGFVKAFGKRDYSGLTAVCIGESTQKAALSYGMPAAVADRATIPAMVELLERLQSEKRAKAPI